MALPSIGLLGRKQSGKSTAGDYLSRTHGYRLSAFADPMRGMAAAINPIVNYMAQTRTGAVEFRYNDAIEAMGYDLAKETFPEVRRFLQRLGTEGGRGHLGDNVWIDAWERATMRGNDERPVAVTDCRFPNEAERLRDLGFLLIRVVRPGQPDSGDTHASETALDNWPAALAVNDGTVEELERKIELLVSSVT